MATTISDQQIITALMNCGTLKETASAVGISERALYDRMNNREFRENYRRAKADVIRKSVFTLNHQIEAAVAIVVEIMCDKDVNPSIRLQAAQTILNNAGKFSERLNEDEKTATEQLLEKKYLFK